MTLNIDLSVAARSLASQRALIEAVADAPRAEPETDFLEWKTAADLSDKKWRLEIARHILGFANRHPDHASQFLEGTGHIAVGVEPGQLVGTAVYDPVEIDRWIGEYVGAGSEGPQWNATYVESRGADVLLVTIEAPRWGHPIWTLQKEYDPYRAGTIFVRRSGRTEMANPPEVRMLTERAGSGPRRLAVDVVLDHAEMHAWPMDGSTEAFDGWLGGQSAALLAPLSLSGLAAVEHLAVAWGGEARTQDEFRSQVASYLDDAKKALLAESRRSAIRNNLGRIQLRLDNETDHNFKEVVVEVRVDLPDVAAYFDLGSVRGPRLPDRPLAWGTQTMARFLEGVTNFSIPSGLTRLDRPVLPRRGNIDNSGSTRIRLGPTDVRPMHMHYLEPFHLLVDAKYAGQILTASWSATATDVSGVASGTLPIPVAASTYEIAKLLALHPSEPDDEHGED
jgi:hypothetical protein